MFTYSIYYVHTFRCFSASQRKLFSSLLSQRYVFYQKKKIKYSHCLGYETICSLYKYYILNFELCLKVEFVILIISLIKVGSNKLGPEIASFIFSQHFKDTSVEHKNFKRSSLTWPFGSANICSWIFEVNLLLENRY
jgi:hypothetical protein